MAHYSEKYDLFLTATQSFCHLCNDLNHLIDTHIVTKENEVFYENSAPNVVNLW